MQTHFLPLSILVSALGLPLMTDLAQAQSSRLAHEVVQFTTTPPFPGLPPTVIRTVTRDTTLSAPHAPELVPQAGITVEFWIDWGSPSCPGCGPTPLVSVVDKSPGGSSAYAITLGSGNVYWDLRTLNLQVTSPLPGGGLGWGRHHIAATYDGTVAVLYVNGVFANQATAAAPGPIVDPTAGPLRIGHVHTFTPPFDGAWLADLGNLDELRIWDHARSGEQIRSSMNTESDCQPGQIATWHFDGDLSDSTGGHDASGAAEFRGEFAPLYRALDLSGGLGSVSVPDAPDLVPAHQITVEAWIQWNGGATGARPTILRKDPAAGQASYLLRIELDRPVWAVFDPSGVLTLLRPNVTVPIGVPTHLAATWDGVTSRLYMNGTEVGNAPSTPGLRPSSGELRIGKGDDSGNEGFDGRIDEVRLWRVARNESEIQSNAFAKIASAPHLVASWQMDGDLTDATGVHHGTGVPSASFVDEFAPFDCDDSPCYETAIGSPLGMSDDDVATIALPFAFPLPGSASTVSSINVCSNGYVWLSPGTSADFSPTVAELVAGDPRLCPLWRDFDPSDSLSDDVYVNALPDRVIVTWHELVLYRTTQPYTIQLQMYPSGNFSFFYDPAIDPLDPALTSDESIAAAWPGSPAADPGATDLSLAVPTDSAASGAIYELFTNGAAIDLRNLRIDFERLPAGDYSVTWACRGLSGMASVTSSGVGCPAGAPLTLAPGTSGARPILGTTMPIELSNVPAGAIAATIWIGFDKPALPLDIINMTGCTYYTTRRADLPVVFAGNPSTADLPLPNDLRLVGLGVNLQGWVIAFGINLFGVVNSDLLELTLGSY